MSDDTTLLEDVLFAFRNGHGMPTPEAVQHWTTRYPRFSSQIREAAAAWAEIEMQSKLSRPSPDDESLVMAARSAALNALHSATNASVEVRLSRTLCEAADDVGITAVEIGRQVALPASVVSQVFRSKVMGATIPEALTRMLARLLRKDVDWIRSRYPAGVMAAYEARANNGGGSRANDVPSAAALTFQEIVMDSHGMDDNQRSYWLKEF